VRRLFELLEPMEAETPYGGRAVSYAPLGMIWLRVEGRRRRERTEAGVTSVLEVVRAEARTDPRLTHGQVVRLDGADWTIALIADDPDRPGRVTLTLEQR
jgi:hypothetical protein